MTSSQGSEDSGSDSKDVTKDVIFLKRRRNELGKETRKEYEKGETELRMKDIRDWTLVPQQESNTVSTFEIDNLIVEPEPTKVFMELRKDKFRVETEDVVPTLVARMGEGGNNVPCIEVKSALIQSRGLETRKDNLSHCLKGAGGGTSKNFIVSGPVTTTDTPTKSTPETSEKKTTTQMTLGESIQKRYPTLISFVQDFLAKRFRLRGSGKVSKTLVERFSSRYAELRKLKDLHYYSSKTLKDSLTMTEEELSRSSFNRWMNWGTGSNGRFLTANISGFPRIGKGCSLSDILERDVPEKYFLSEKLIKMLLRHAKKHKEKGHGFGLQIHYPEDTTRMEVKT